MLNEAFSIIYLYGGGLILSLHSCLLKGTKTACFSLRELGSYIFSETPHPIWLDDQVPDNGNEWRKFRAVRTSLVPLAFPCFVLYLIRVEAEGLLDYQGRAGIISIVRWNLRPVIFGVEKRPFVHDSVCSQFLEGLFAILAECSQFCLRSF